MACDVLIVGAGSAGSVLADRCSADERCRVTVVEAGPGFDDPAANQQIRDGLRLPIGSASSVVRRYHTELTAFLNRPASLMRGHVVGGSGAVNGGYFCRALPRDFAEWAVDGWSWTQVLPHFRAVENDLDTTGRLHGQSGPVTVRRMLDFASSTEQFVADAGASGFAWLPDLNGADAGQPWPAGVGAVPLNVADGVRVGPGGAFLQPALARANLTLLTGTEAVRVLFRDGRATGVRCADGRVLRGDRIVLCAGAIESAALLMRSGIGPEAVLAAAGVPMVCPLPVAAAFGDHPELVVPVDWPVTAGRPVLEAVLATDDDLEIRPYTSGFAAMTDGPGSRVDDSPHLGVALMKPRSRGRMRIVSPDHRVPPVIEHRYDSAPADEAILRGGVELATDLVSPGTRAGPASWSTSQHLCGTAPMGTGPAAVVDQRCRVRGVDALYVVDGSILPSPPSRGPHATIVMAAARAAEFVTG